MVRPIPNDEEWDYYGGGYTVGEAIDDTNQVGAGSRDIMQNFYHAILGRLSDAPSFFNLNWVPQRGNYAGNGENDA